MGLLLHLRRVLGFLLLLRRVLGLLMRVHHNLLGELILDLACYCSHHWILVMHLLQNLCLLHCHDVQRVAESRIVNLIEYDVHVSLTQPMSINEVLYLIHIQSHLLGLLEELFSLHLEKLWNRAGHHRFAHRQLLLILLSLHFCFWKWWNTPFAHKIE